MCGVGTCLLCGREAEGEGGVGERKREGIVIEEGGKRRWVGKI